MEKKSDAAWRMRGKPRSGMFPSFFSMWWRFYLLYRCYSSLTTFSLFCPLSPLGLLIFYFFFSPRGELPSREHHRNPTWWSQWDLRARKPLEQNSHSAQSRRRNENETQGPPLFCRHLKRPVKACFLCASPHPPPPPPLPPPPPQSSREFSPSSLQ